MVPTLCAGDFLLLLTWTGSRLNAGDVVVVRQGDRELVKRVSAVDRQTGRFNVLGDNPKASSDSRSFGQLAATALVGRGVLRIGRSGFERIHRAAPGAS